MCEGDGVLEEETRVSNEVERYWIVEKKLKNEEEKLGEREEVRRMAG